MILVYLAGNRVVGYQTNTHRTTTDAEGNEVQEQIDPGRPHVVVDDPALEQIIIDQGIDAVTVAGGQVRQKTQSEIDAAELPRRIAERKQEADRLRAQKIAAGMPYTFPDGQTGTVQLRSQVDIANVQGVASSGQALVMAGDSTTTLQFRDAEDISHALTGQQAIEMGLAVSGFISAHYAAAWAHKDAIAGSTTVAQVEGFDITTGWPS